jgi:PBSX family phage portal protein
MADRVVRPADEENTLPEITHVSTVTVRDEVVNTDRFAKSAEDLRAVSGTTPAFKRRTTNEIKKFQQGIGDAKTKQIHEKEFLTGYDMYEVVEPPYNLDYLAKLYEISAPHFAAVNAKVANIVGLGYKFVESNKTKKALERLQDNANKLKAARNKLDDHREELHEMLESINEEDTFTEVLIKVWRDYEVTGNGYLEVGRKKDGTIGYLGHIPAQTMRIRKKRDGFVQLSGFDVQFFAHFGHGDERNPIGGGKPNEVIHIKKYSPTSGYYGIPDIVAAKQAVAGNEFAARYNLDYFENKAVPRYAIILKGATLSPQAEANLLSFFQTGMKGVNHRSIYIPLPADTQDSKVELKLEAIEASVQDSSFNNYRKANLADILMAHRVPVSKVSTAEGASLAIARDADKTFKEQVCAPEQRIFEKKIAKIIKELTDAFVWELVQMTLTDEDTQSKIDERRIKTGVETANEQRLRRGLPGHENGDELVDLNAKDKIAQAQAEERAVRERDSARSAGATDSAGEARSPQGEGRTTP